MVSLMVDSSCSAQDTKRGMAGGGVEFANALNSRWYYHWGNTPPADVANGNFDGEYVPMIWSANTTNVQGRVDNILSYEESLNVEYVLGFNEPERPDQANMSVANAIAVWDIMDDQLSGAGLKLVSPAVSDNQDGRDWLADFMSQAATNNLQVDEVAFHWYGGVNPNNPTASANSFLGRVDSYHNTYGLPVWITEFAGLDFGDDSVTSPELIAANAAFLDVVIPGLESRSYVNRYSWWAYGQPDNGEQDDSQVIKQIDGVWTPTVIGDQYLPSYASGETFNINGLDYGKDTIYLKGGTITNTGSTTAAIDSIHAIEGTNTISGPADWTVGASEPIEIHAGATLLKNGNNSITYQGSTVNNRGLLHVSTGRLNLSAGAQIGGMGTFQVDGGAVLSLGAESDRAGVVISQSLDLHGATINTQPIADGTHVLSGDVTVHSTPTFSGEGLLIATGPLAAPAGGGGGGIIKDGAGMLLLNNTNTYEGTTVIKNGVLKLESAASIDTSPAIGVGPGGVLDVTAKTTGFLLDGQLMAIEGQVLGSVNATNGSTVSALGSGNSLVGNLTVSNATVSVGGPGFNETAPPTPTVSTGLQLNFDAALDTPSDATWTNAAAPANSLAFAGIVAPDTVSDSNYSGITAAYDISATSEASGLNNYFEQQGPQRSQQDATFEVVFYVSDTTAGTDQVLFEVGATRGVSFTLSDSSLSFNVDGDGSTLSLSTTLAAGWHHAVGVIDLEGVNDNAANDAFELFVNNVSVGSSANQLIDDWAGGNTTGVGGNSAGTAGTTTPIDFHGKIAAARYYNDYRFSPEDVAQNFAALVGSGITMPSTMQIDGDYLQQADATLEVDLLSPAMHDVLEITGAATLAGLLEVSEIAGFNPSSGDAFTILTAAGGLTGEFDAVELPELAGMQWLVDYSATEVTLSVILGADFDGSGLVDGQDFLQWQRGAGLSGQIENSTGDADGNGVVDANDLAIWNLQYGTAAALQAGAVALVPEPSAATLLLVTLLGLALRSGRETT